MARRIRDSEKRLLTNLLQLQNLVKRDPESYESEFTVQWKRFRGLLDLFKLNPGTYNKDVEELTYFLAQVSHCYKEHLKEFPELIREVLLSQATVLNPSNRMSFVKALILLRGKGLIDAASLLQLFFRLFRCQDKILRKTIFNYIVQDIKNINAKHKNLKLNTTLQNFMYTMLRDKNPVAAKMSLDVMIELYRRNIWKDDKTVNVIVTACCAKVTKIKVAALKFFLGKEPGEDDSDSEDEEPQKSAKELLLAHKVGKKSRKRKKKLQRALDMVKKRKKNKDKCEVFDYSALRMVHDPYDFSDKLMQLATQKEVNEAKEVKMMTLDVVSRLIGVHQLLVLDFYPELKKKLGPRDEDVTRRLLFVAQASHPLVPPNAIEEVLREIADNFITEAVSSDTMAVGLNAVREICARCPLAISEALLQDLVQYKTHKSKAVMTAARSLLQLYRLKNPEMLRRKDRGKPTEATEERRTLAYGEVDARDFIPGAEALLKFDEEQEDQEGWQSASEEEDVDSDSDGWIDVHHSSDEAGDGTQQQKLTAEDLEERRKQAQEVSSSRIMTQEDFRRMEEAQLAKEAGIKTNAKSRKRKRPSDAQDRGELPSLDSIVAVEKRRAHDRDSRLSTVMEGREGRGKFTWGHQRMNPHASTTNKEKKKNKAFMMIKHKPKLKEKKKRSFREKQIALKNSLLKREKKKKK